MLVSSGDLPATDGWSYEVRWDGIRALVWNAAGRLTVWTRHGKPLTEQFPELQDVSGGVWPYGTRRRSLRLVRPRSWSSTPPSSPAAISVPVRSPTGVPHSTGWICRPATDVSPSTITRAISSPAPATSGWKGWCPSATGPPIGLGARSSDRVKVKHHDTTALQIAAARRKAGPMRCSSHAPTQNRSRGSTTGRQSSRETSSMRVSRRAWCCSVRSSTG